MLLVLSNAPYENSGLMSYPDEKNATYPQTERGKPVPYGKTDVFTHVLAGVLTVRGI